MTDNKRSMEETKMLLDQLLSAFESIHKLWDDFEAKLKQKQENTYKKAA